MVEYTKRSCHDCGAKDIQPNMQLREIEGSRGTSKSQVHVGTWIGAAAGYKPSRKRVANVFFANNQRGYVRKTKVWLCHDCAEKRPKGLGWKGMFILSVSLFCAGIYFLEILNRGL